MRESPRVQGWRGRGGVSIPRRPLSGLLLTAPLLLAACSDPKTATKANFQKALTAFFDKNCAMIAVGLTGFPYKVDMDFSGQPNPSATGLGAKQFQAFLDAGFLTETRSEEPVRNIFGQPRGTIEQPDTTPKFTYDLTPAGKSAWRALNSAGPGSPGGFCVGHIEVVSVDRFTDPITANGVRMSQVTFTMRAGYDDWAKAPTMKAIFPEQLGRDQPAQQTFPMVLTNTGWAVASGLPTPAGD